MSDPFYTEAELSAFSQPPNTLIDRAPVDSMLFNIMEALKQLVILQGGNAVLNDAPDAPKFTLSAQNNNTNLLLCGVLEELQKLNHKIEVLLS